MASKKSNTAKIFKALGDENRLYIVELLSAGEMSANAILDKLNFTQPTLSHHMSILCEADVLNCRRVGKWTYYSINSDALAEAGTMLSGLKTETFAEAPAAKKPATKTVRSAAPKTVKKEPAPEPVKEEKKEEEAPRRRQVFSLFD